MDEIILLILISLSMLTTYCLYRMQEKKGLYFSLILMNILTFILTFKVTTILKININCSIINMIPVFTIIYLLLSKYSYKEARNIILFTLYSNIITAILIAIMNRYVPAVTETISINMQATFEYNCKILIIYPVIMIISEYIIIKIFKLINDIQNNQYVSIILTYILTGILYTVIFCILSYINILEIRYSLLVGVSTYIIGIFITIINLLLFKYIYDKKAIINE